MNTNSKKNMAAQENLFGFDVDVEEVDKDGKPFKKEKKQSYGPFDKQPYLQGKVAPVFFGSAINNFGVKELLETFIQVAPLPQHRPATPG